jgi:hypothetical protein
VAVLAGYDADLANESTRLINRLHDALSHITAIPRDRATAIANREMHHAVALNRAGHRLVDRPLPNAEPDREPGPGL